jgi:hypothetical protein
MQNVMLNLFQYLESADSSLQPAESSSLSYGLAFHLPSDNCHFVNHSLHICTCYFLTDPYCYQVIIIAEKKVVLGHTNDKYGK